MDLINYYLDPQLLTLFFAALTFIVLCVYTYFTYKMAQANKEILNETVRPTVSCELKSGKNYYSNEQINKDKKLEFDTRVIVTNYSKYNLEVYVDLGIKINNKPQTFSGDYSGTIPWPITSFQSANGHFNLSEKFNFENAKTITLDLQIRYKSDIGKEYKNPIQYWHFDLEEKIWRNSIGAAA